jgi:hypothetical protein
MNATTQANCVPESGLVYSGGADGRKLVAVPMLIAYSPLVSRPALEETDIDRGCGR